MNINFNNYKDQENCMCIYQILNIENGRSYIGQTKNFHNRIYVHKSSLIKNENGNMSLQAVFNLRGFDAFEIKILKVFNEYNSKEFTEWERKFYLEVKKPYNLMIPGETRKDFKQRVKVKKLIKKLKKK